MSTHIQAIDTSSIVFSSHSGFSLIPRGATMPQTDAVSNGQGNHGEYGPEFLMKSGENAVSGWKLFEWPQEKQPVVTSNQHNILRSKGR